MKLNGLMMLISFIFSQASFAQHPSQSGGCCVKELTGASGLCIYHAPLHGSTSCPQGFDFVDTVKSLAACPVQGAQPIQSTCP